MSTVNNNIPFVPENTTDPAAGLNQALNVIDALLQIAVLGIQSAPPGSPAEGDRYIVSPTGTAAWAGHDNQLARWQNGAWNFYDARIAVNLGDSRIYSFDGTAWTDPAGGGVTALQPGDNVSELVNDVPYVETVNGETGPTISLDADDIDDTSTTNKFATQAQLDAADGALQAVNNLLDLDDAEEARDNLGLGTASLANVTESSTDITAGRALLVGARFEQLNGGTLTTSIPVVMSYGAAGGFRVLRPTSENNVSMAFVNSLGATRYLGTRTTGLYFGSNPDLGGAGSSLVYTSGNLGSGTPSKGDILVHDGTNYVRLPAGTDGQVLTANSSEDTGVEWV